ncbi:MAG: PA2778 family cysteine peptidase [Gammaproteobacteria bacterium]
MSYRSAKARRRLPPLLAIGLFALVASGCSLPLQSSRIDEWPAARQAVELTEVPFHPQERYQCGPAALATLLNHSGVKVSPATLRDQVYLPDREGSLQVEILAATRRHGRIPYRLRPELVDLLRELQAGRPVLVLQNLALAWAPRWHYAVVVGYLPEERTVVLRSGTRRRHRVPIDLFERTWRRGGYWGLVVLRPGELPATAEERRYLESVVPLERLRRWEAVEQAYQAALERWPESLVALMGLGNSRYARGDLAGAMRAFRRAVEAHPGSAAAHNNLAHLLAEQGDLPAALAHARRAVALSDDPRYRNTLAEIETRR